MGGLANLGLTAIQDVRVGKNISVQVVADSADQAKELARAAAQKLLANPVMEYFELECRPA
jgi:phosphoribosylformylglycinamidine synthase